MRSRQRGTGLLGAAVLGGLGFLAACGGSGDATAEVPRQGTTAVVATEVAARFDAAPLIGSVGHEGLDAGPTVLWFWAPWCTICRAEAPDVLAVADEFAGSVALIGVAGRGETASMEDFVTETATGTLAHVADLDGGLWSAFEVYSQPAFAFIDDDGALEVFNGAMGTDALAERISELVAA